MSWEIHLVQTQNQVFPRRFSNKRLKLTYSERGHLDAQNDPYFLRHTEIKLSR